MSVNNLKTQNEIININGLNKETKIKVDIIAHPIDLGLAHLCYEEELEKEALFNFIKSKCRTSYEYKKLMNYIKENGGNNCRILKKLDFNKQDFMIEIHHFPIGMDAIVKAVTKKMFLEAEGKPLCLLDIMNKIMEEHYNGRIGLVPLSETAHTTWHQKGAKLHLDEVKDYDWESFYEDYYDFFDDNVKKQVLEIRSLTREQVDNFNKNKFKKIISEYEVEYTNLKDEMKKKSIA